MPALNFTVLIDKVESGEKRHTIRKPRKNPIKPGDKLYHYTGMRHPGCRKLGEAICRKVLNIDFRLIDLFEDGTEEYFGVFYRGCKNSWTWKQEKKLAKDNGFDSWEDFKRFFIDTYKIKRGDVSPFDIIEWMNFVKEPTCP